MSNRRRKPMLSYLPKSMEAFLLYGVDTIEDDFSLDVFIIKIRTQQVIAEWGKHRSRLLDEWKHPSVMPYGECLQQGKEPDKVKLRELYDMEVKA